MRSKTMRAPVDPSSRTGCKTADIAGGEALARGALLKGRIERSSGTVNPALQATESSVSATRMSVAELRLVDRAKSLIPGSVVGKSRWRSKGLPGREGWQARAERHGSAESLGHRRDGLSMQGILVVRAHP